MSFKCHAVGKVIQGEKMHLMPTEIRKINYYGVFKPNPNEDYWQVGKFSEGWEIAKEVPVAESNYKAFLESNTPKIVGEKEVRYIMPRKRRQFKSSDQREYDEGEEEKYDEFPTEGSTEPLQE